MTTALEVEQIAESSGAARFKLVVLNWTDLVVHSDDSGENPTGYTEGELHDCLTATRGLGEPEAHLLIAQAKARFNAAQATAR